MRQRPRIGDGIASGCRCSGSGPTRFPRRRRLRSRDREKSFLERWFVAGDEERALVNESKLIFSFLKKIREDRMVQVRSADDEAFVFIANVEGDVAGWDVRRDAIGCRWVAPAFEELFKTNNAADDVWFLRRRRHWRLWWWFSEFVLGRCRWERVNEVCVYEAVEVQIALVFWLICKTTLSWWCWLVWGRKGRMVIWRLLLN